jgi:uncharacterized protein with HEPN domain
MPRDESHALDIVNAARRVLEFTTGYDRTAFERDAKTQSAVLHQITIIGEAAKRLSEEFKDRYARVPWSDIARMRDKLIHHYNDVVLDRVWEAVTTDIPELLRALEELGAPKP